MKKKITKKNVLLASLVLVVLMTAGATLALLLDNSGPVTNTFTPSKVACEVHEPEWKDGESTNKTNVTIKNIGDTDAYIRAAIVVTWQDENGVILAQKPVENTDYILDINEDDWFVKDDFYYHKEMVPAAENLNDISDTEVLINSCEVKTVKEGYKLHVEIMAEAIQYEGVAQGTAGNIGEKPVEIAWNIFVDENGKLTETAPAVTE